MQDTYTQFFASKYSEWGGDYWLARCLEGKQTLIMSMNDDENNHFPTGSMVVKGEYLTHDNNERKKCHIPQFCKFR